MKWYFGDNHFENVGKNCPRQMWFQCQISGIPGASHFFQGRPPPSGESRCSEVISRSHYSEVPTGVCWDGKLLPPFPAEHAFTMAPLYTALTSKPKTLTWGPTQPAAFIAAKYALSSAAYLKFLMPGLPLVLSTDASDIAIGAVLEQVSHGA